MSTPTTARLLTFAGAIPFVGLTILAVSGSDWLSINPAQALLTYGAVIVSFISGIHWAQALNHEKQSGLLWHSNIVALLAWLSSLLSTSVGVPILIFCLVYLLVLDYQLFKQTIITACFWRLRLQITSIVLLSLLTLMLAS